MMENFIESAEHIYLACGVTDFRKYNLNDEKELEKYLPWSDELPTEFKNTDSEVLKVNKSLLSK